MNNPISVGPLDIEKEPRFNGMFIKIAIDDFIAKGFNFGDSINLTFSNKVKIKDIPFYSAYYVAYDQLLLVGYQGYPYIDLMFNYTGNVMNRLNLSINDTVEISLNEKGKYLLIQDTLSQKHSNDRSDYKSDESFSNFREITKSSNKQAQVYRSASPCDDDYNRAYFVSELCRKYEINYIFDLSNDQSDIDSYYQQKEVNNQYWKYLYEQNRIIPSHLNVDYRSNECAQTIVKTLKFIINNDGPFLMHCSEGKDRTGFFAIVICAISKQTIDDIENDYMKTYEEYYDITKQEKADSYYAIKDIYFDPMIKYLCDNKNIEEIKDIDVYNYAKKYLITNGMKEEEINKLEKTII